MSAAAFDEQDETPRRRAADNVSIEQVENLLRRVIAEELGKLETKLYDRTLQPIIRQIDDQQAYCVRHSQELTTVHTLLDEVVDAKLIRRLSVVESDLSALTAKNMPDRVAGLERNMSILGKATTVIGVIAGSAMVGILVSILTHTMSVP